MHIITNKNTAINSGKITIKDNDKSVTFDMKDLELFLVFVNKNLSDFYDSKFLQKRFYNEHK